MKQKTKIEQEHTERTEAGRETALFTEAFTPRGAGLMMEETRRLAIQKAYSVNYISACNIATCRSSFLRGHKGNEGIKTESPVGRRADYRRTAKRSSNTRTRTSGERRRS